MASYLFTLLALCLVKTALVAAECNVPPEFWCDSVEIAAKCDVLAQCRDRLVPNSSAKKVDIGLYYEYLCPGCKDFIEGQMFPTFQKVPSIMNVTLVPFGNAREYSRGGQWDFMCQHGVEECQGNLIETCAIHLLKDASKYFPLINCMERSYGSPQQAATTCGASLQISVTEILQCSTSAQGNALEHQMALKTLALNPPHEYTPWVTVNGVHTQAQQTQAMYNLLKLVCDTYTGSPKPAACS